ncbi:SUMO-targeted ubiquitin ligase complex subunit SLX5 NDAI_0A06510 [Naumovozyma dairenensis CBS 421]|uniref:Uncharacterized protein n=1 Tax=Naumovozyma dairenensis (strain ATCC 10597 / BCRC 20456 / CBS 421 / NBRC 0211 / NRRL Y-12639) TaxID=1071378 RepID=G0W4R7_NAUDC|nr:hypothetical protein NDAI_0A06510 [Naumovozyma dairenensis CBS 421]CCD22805.1 hypothetical protein NDAI_0A06510 [Naumovozyma dairenensis CBS 421]
MQEEQERHSSISSTATPILPSDNVAERNDDINTNENGTPSSSATSVDKNTATATHANNTEGSNDDRGDDNDNDNNNSAILIESDPEEDARIREESRQISLVPDRRIGRPRDALHRFISTNPNNTNTTSRRDAQEENEENDENDDDFAIMDEIIDPTHNNNNINEIGPIDPTAEYVDLDAEPEYITNSRPRTIIINNNSSNNNIENSNGDANDDDDDEVMILEERTSTPTVTLNLPGGERLRINADPNERPTRSSFESLNENIVPLSRRQLLRRATRRATNSLFFHGSDENESDNDTDEVSLPASILGMRQRARMMAMQERQRQRQGQGQGHSAPDTSGNSVDNTSTNRNLINLRERIHTYPPDVRGAFDHAQSLQEFTSIVQSVAPTTFAECSDDLISLFTQYRGQVMADWTLRRIRQSQRDNERLLRERHARVRSTIRANNRHFGSNLASFFLMNQLGLGYGDVGAADDEDDGDYGIGEEDNDTGRAAGAYGYEYEDDDAHTQNIINMIQRREDAERDSRTKGFMSKTKPQQDGFKKRALALPEGYSSSFSTEPKVKMTVKKNGKDETVIMEDVDLAKYWMDVPACILCGVELGVGIPKDFVGTSDKDHGVSFEFLVSKYDFHCPYQSLSKPSQLDRDLSQKVYVASCGHTFCGRCYVRIDNAKSKSKLPKKKLAELKGSSHPDNYGPKTCPGPSCKTLLRSRGRMREIYF